MPTIIMPNDSTVLTFLEILSRRILQEYSFMKAGELEPTKISDATIFGDSSLDQDLAADRILGDAVLDFCQGYDWIRTITIEGRDLIILNEDGLVDLFLDPLDGSLNWHRDPNGFLFQHGFCATLIKAKQEPCFRDIIGVLGINLSRGIPMIAVTNSDPLCEMWETHIPVPEPKTPLGLRKDLNFDPGQNLMIWESYYSEMRVFLSWATKNDHVGKGWLRSPGSAVVEMMATAMGISSAFVCSMQKMHELGMGYILVNAHGGVCLNLETGEDLSHHPFNFDSKAPVVLAANRTIAEKWVKIYKAFLLR